MYTKIFSSGGGKKRKQRLEVMGLKRGQRNPEKVQTNEGKETELRCKGREIDGGGGGVEERDGGGGVEEDLWEGGALTDDVQKQR